LNRQDVLLILLTSVGLIVSFPPIPMGFVATVAFIPFFIFLRDKGLATSFKGGYAVGVLWAGGTLYWIGWATLPGLLGALLFLPLFTALYAVIQNWLWKRFGESSLWAAPVLWTGVEIVSSAGVLGFPWNSLAYSQSYFPSLIQFITITGMYGVTFWIVLLNVLFYFLLQKWGEWRSTLGFCVGIVLLFLLPWGYGKWTIFKANEPDANIRVALIQGNIDPYKKWTPSFIDSNFVVYQRLTNQAGIQKPNLVVWPETAAPCYLRHRFSYLNMVKSQIDSLDVPLLTGAPDYKWVDEDKVEKYNGALLIHPKSWRIQRYYKNRLVPFSERVPLVDRLPFLFDLLNKMDSSIGDFSPGDSTKVLEFHLPKKREKVRFSVIICYESIFSEFVRKFVHSGAQFLVIITNDGWFGRTSGPYQHAQLAVLRAIENRVWVARCANTGISEFIDPYGRIHGKTPLDEEAVLTGMIYPLTEQTIFTQYGHFIPYIVIVLNGFILLLGWLRKKQ